MFNWYGLWERHQRVPLCLLSSHAGTGFNAYTHAQAHTPPFTNLSTCIYIEEEKGRKRAALWSEEPSQINLFPVLSLMHLHHSLLTYFLPSLLSPLFPPVLALSQETLFMLFSLCEWTGPIISLFNEHVVFFCSAHSPNTPSPTLAAFWEGDSLCVCVCMREWEEKEVEGEILLRCDWTRPKTPLFNE